MKPLILKLMLVVLCLLGKAYAKNNVFYYSDNRKITLSVDTNIIVYKTKSDIVKEQIQKKFPALQYIDENKHQVIRLSTNKAIANSKQGIITSYCQYLANSTSI
ncbi:MAG: hypothetical protein H6553_11165 [Chitinophagales bacterium]|nr:hypothetical protein [Chitinophagales bacterium]